MLSASHDMGGGKQPDMGGSEQVVRHFIHRFKSMSYLSCNHKQDMDKLLS